MVRSNSSICLLKEGLPGHISVERRAYKYYCVMLCYYICFVAKCICHTDLITFLRLLGLGRALGSSIRKQEEIDLKHLVTLT